MPKYRFHFLSADRKRGQGHTITCDSDTEALIKARKLHHAHGVDVWEGRRKLARVKGELRISR